MDMYGQRVVLSTISHDDLDFLCQIECDAQLWYFEESVPSDVDAVREKFVKRIEASSEKANRFDFVITLQADGDRTPIGLAQIWSYIESRKSWEIGYALLPSYTGKGYAREAVGLLLQFAFGTLSAHKVVGMCNAKNKRSTKLMEQAGMTREGVFREELFWQNQWTDQYYYSILEKEFNCI